MRSPLVDLTARHKKVCVGYLTAAPDSVDCHRGVIAGLLRDKATFAADNNLTAGFTLQGAEHGGSTDGVGRLPTYCVVFRGTYYV